MARGVSRQFYRSATKTAVYCHCRQTQSINIRTKPRTEHGIEMILFLDLALIIPSAGNIAIYSESATRKNTWISWSTWISKVLITRAAPTGVHLLDDYGQCEPILRTACREASMQVHSNALSSLRSKILQIIAKPNISWLTRSRNKDKSSDSSPDQDCRRQHWRILILICRAPWYKFCLWEVSVERWYIAWLVNIWKHVPNRV